ncbi:MAG: outer membrane lipoprotein carrier protein LolA [Deferrisomatales bacterium]|nr:outer membrane lipoprotein carrier protein LolA [Deferrisomatales bacterium]
MQKEHKNKNKSNVGRLLCAGVLALLLAAPGVRAAEPEAVLEGLRRAYEETADLTARFVQTAYLVAAGLEREAQGRVALKKGGMMRWTYEGDDPQEIVSDGRTLWVHQVRDRTVLRQELAAVPEASRLALDLLSGFQGVEGHFDAASCGELCLALTPRDARPDLSRVLVEAAPGGGEVRAVTTEDPLGNRTRVEFFDVRRNTGLGDEHFAFRPPEGAQVLDMPGGP